MRLFLKKIKKALRIMKNFNFPTFGAVKGAFKANESMFSKRFFLGFFLTSRFLKVEQKVQKIFLTLRFSVFDKNRFTFFSLSGLSELKIFFLHFFRFEVLSFWKIVISFFSNLRFHDFENFLFTFFSIFTFVKVDSQQMKNSFKIVRLNALNTSFFSLFWRSYDFSLIIARFNIMYRLY